MGPGIICQIIVKNALNPIHISRFGSNITFKLIPLSFSTQRFLLLTVISFLSAVAGDRAFGQVTIHGTVYNMYRTKPLDGVSVIANTGHGTATDSNGNYVITVNP